MAKLSTKADLATPTLESRLHIIKQITGTWTSFSVSLETIKNFILTYVIQPKVTTLTFLGAGHQDYVIAQYENLEYAVFKYNDSADTISIGLVANPGLYYDTESGEQIFILNQYRTAAGVPQRTIRITVSAACTVKLKSMTGL